MRLGDILARDATIGAALAPDLLARDVTAIAADSRRVAPGALFFAVSGTKVDGLAFADEAVRRGAVAIVSDRQPAHALTVPVIEVADVRAELSHAAARLHPRQPATIAAVTGTSGKTSVAAFLRQIWRACGRAAASLGTIGLVTPSGETYGSLTTPDPVTLHETLDRLAGDGVTHLAMEASSHGLDQRRLDGVRLSAAGFTNLSRDHLDYHADLDEYLAAKLRLFDALLPAGRSAVIEAGSDVAGKVAAAAHAHGCVARLVGSGGDFIRLDSATPHHFSTRLAVVHDGARYEIDLPLAGAFQVSNALVAAGLALAAGERPAQVFAALEKLDGAPGRLERIGERDGAGIFVDYAHKPDALAKTLAALRPLTRRNLVLVFGCGGDRDRGKRPLMGAIAAKDADIAVVTDDNPRTEEPAAIRREILAGMHDGTAKIIEIGDRRGAIESAIAMLGQGDMLVVAGKGHEAGQIVGAQVLPFSDHEVIREALHRTGGAA
jgi:UDP-N-acetylmuramoyl-L-alanyl-D-glutamate--2,6-diaminopimelate ligase